MEMTQPLKVLIGGEHNGIIRDEFLALGHNAISCDFKKSVTGGPHYQGDWQDIEADGFDLAIYHHTCTFMANSGAKHLYAGMRKENGLNEDRFLKCIRAAWAMWKHKEECPVPHAAWENPVMLPYAHSIVGKRNQSVQPWWFGHEEDGPDNVTKETWWWFKKLPPLKRTGSLDGSTARPEVHLMAPTKDPEVRRMARSKFHPGHAAALAQQWSEYVLLQKALAA